MDEKAKIEFLMTKFNYNSAQFAEEVGIKNSTLSHILNDRNKPSLDVLKKILGRFHEINPEWLILNAGEMYRPTINSQEPTLFDSIDLTINKTNSYINNLRENTESQKQSKEKINRKIESHEIDAVSKTENATLNDEKLEEKIVEKIFVPQIEFKHKIIERIIIYYDDNTFEEFDPKVRNT